MKIEHWRCRANYPAKELDYRNLLASCRGGEGLPRQHQHCDTGKADDDLRWNPADPHRRVEDRIGYGIDGAIRSDDPPFDAQMNEVLNLNLARIKRNREASLHAVARGIRGRSRTGGAWRGKSTVVLPRRSWLLTYRS